MGINLRNVPGSYLSKSSKESEGRKAQSEMLQEILSLLKSMPWQNIEFEYSGSPANRRTFYVKLPEQIIAKIKAYKQKFNDNLQISVGNWKQLDEGSPVYMETEPASSFHRSHFPNNGIPTAFKGIGLGYKLYRKLLEVNKFLRSDTSGTNIKDNAWASLIKKRPDPDDVHAIVGPASVFAMIKTLTREEKIDLVEQYLTSGNLDLNSLSSNNFAIDDELKSILPQELANIVNNPQSVRHLSGLQQRAADRSRMTEIQQRTEANRQLFPVWGIRSIDTNWAVGDFVARFTYLDDNSARLRIIINYDGIKAVSVADYIKLSVTGTLDRNAVARTPDRQEWTKVDIAAIANLSDLRLSVAERAFVKSLVDSGRHSAPDPRQNTAAQQVATQQTRTSVYGPLLRTHDTAEFKEMIEGRMLREETARKIKQGNFVHSILLSPAQEERMNSGLCTEVFVPFDGSVTNMRTPQTNGISEKAVNTISGFVVTAPGEMQFTLKNLSEIRRKSDLRVGEMVYIANHPTYYGLVAKVSMKVRNPNGIEYAMLSIFNANLGGEFRRKVSIEIASLRKIS